MPKQYPCETTTIGVRKRDYLALDRRKQAVEKEIGRRLYWSDFLLIATGLKSLDAERRISGLAHGERPNEGAEVPFLCDASQLEETVARHVEMAIKRTKNLK